MRWVIYGNNIGKDLKNRLMNRFIEYVVDSLLKKTTIDYDEVVIRYPFLPTAVVTHLTTVYGCEEDEVDIIWNLYREKLRVKMDKDRI